jgi:glutamyl-tRNA synthetase
MTVTVRFAPSPTGYIHIGNARTALFNWLYALKHQGRFVLRFDDTDVERSRQKYADAIATDVVWLGITPDRIDYQSKRSAAHHAAADQLRAAGLLYPCYESADELERRRKIRLTRRLPPIYGREALSLSAAERAKLEKDGRKPHWRLLLPNFDDDPMDTRRTEVHWDDIIRGPQTVDLASMSDPVLVREDGTFLYTLPSVADDIEMAISHVIRGDDHVTNTGAQIALFRALGAEPPAFGHHNLLTTSDGEGLSKRTGALSIGSLRERGFEPMAVASLAVLVGTAEAVRAVPDMAELASIFDPAATSKSAAKFDPQEVETLNATLVRGLAYADVATRLAELGIAGDRAEEFWALVRGNCAFVADARTWWDDLMASPAKNAVPDSDLAFVAMARDRFPEGPVNAGTWKIWTDGLKGPSGRKGKDLYLPLRLALTGLPSGPEIADLLPLLGREEILDRLA